VEGPTGRDLSIVDVLFLTTGCCGHFFDSMSGKMSITAGDNVFYYMTRDSLCFLTMAEARYPKRLAFLYLDEVGDLVLGEMLREFGNEVGGHESIISSFIDFRDNST
jgi:hypothetical protein